MSIRDKMHDPAFTTSFHKYATIAWILLVIPTLIWWRESVLWVALMSIWANVASHWAAYQASRAEQNATR
jgi:hypothetical protein